MAIFIKEISKRACTVVREYYLDRMESSIKEHLKLEIMMVMGNLERVMEILIRAIGKLEV